MTSSLLKNSRPKDLLLLMWSGAVCCVIMWVFPSLLKMKLEQTCSITMRGDYVTLLHNWLPSSTEDSFWQMLLVSACGFICLNNYFKHWDLNETEPCASSTLHFVRWQKCLHAAISLTVFGEQLLKGRQYNIYNWDYETVLFSCLVSFKDLRQICVETFS